MYHNNISERSSSRVLQQPGGRQSHNIFGGGDDQPEQFQRGGRRGVQQPQSTLGQEAEPAAQTADSAPQVAAGQRRVQDEAPVQRQAARSVNNIWGGDDDVQQKPSTRVNNRPGGSSAGVAGALSSDEPAQVNYRSGAARANQTSDNSPFSNAPMPDPRAASNRAKQVSDDSPFSNQPAPVRSSTRVTHAPGGQSSNILSWQ